VRSFVIAVAAALLTATAACDPGSHDGRAAAHTPAATPSPPPPLPAATRPSRIDFGNDEPVDLVGTDGRTYYPRMSFGVLDEGIFPGRSLTDPYVFPVPAGTKPAYAVVTLFGGIGFPSTVDLRMP
jgi:hypothetical protein